MNRRYDNTRKFFAAWFIFVLLIILATLAGGAFTVYKVLAFVGVF